MCHKGRFTKIFAILLTGLVAMSLFTNGFHESGDRIEASQSSLRIFDMPVSGLSDPLAYLFQIIFFLFFISPPLIVILLFLIWKELKKRNDLK